MRWAWALFLLTRGAMFALAVMNATVPMFGRPFRAGGPNITLYAYFAEVVERGGNPYTLTGGPVSPNYADYPPLLMALFGSLAHVMPPRMGVLLVCFAGELALFTATLAVAKRRLGGDRWLTVAMVLANPAWIATEVYDLQYKTWIAAGLVALHLRYSHVLAGALAGAFAWPALLIPMRLRQDRDWRAAAVSCAVAAACWLPFFPTAWGAIGARRADRMASIAYGISPLLGVPEYYWPWVYGVGLAVSVALVLPRGNQVVRGSAALAVLALMSPEAPLNRVLAFAMPVLICAEMPWRSRALSLAACFVTWTAYELRYGAYGEFGGPWWVNVLIQSATVAAVLLATQTPRQSS